MTDTAPTARLRAAADLIEQTAAAASRGPWLPEHGYGGSRP